MYNDNDDEIKRVHEKIDSIVTLIAALELKTIRMNSEIKLLKEAQYGQQTK